MPFADIEWLTSRNASQVAFQRLDGRGPGIVWLGGFKSDMTGTKAAHLAQWAREQGRAFVRFDYRGHGRSGGDFEHLGIGDWLDDALAVLDQLTAGPLVLVGSSMGGWLSLLAGLARPDRLAGLVLIAPAADFTQRLIWDGLDGQARQTIETEGRWRRPSAYGDDPYVITRHLIESGRAHLLLHAPIGVTAPVRILHGMADPDVPWRLSLEIAERLVSDDVRLSFIKSGDHRLSKPGDLILLQETLAGLLADIE
jgi:pimeloyl-ACP methyl ester carboxylesterase